MKSPDIEWLERRWGLPPEAAESVLRLLLAEKNGSTAVPLRSLPPSWGQAAATADESPRTPLVVIEHEGRRFLQSRRFFETERILARQFVGRSEAAVPARETSEQLDALFPGVRSDDRQRQAVKTALSRNLALITGGPGTGKTHTLARILTLLCEEGIPPRAIRVAAPTGKAAERMKKAVLESLDHLPAAFHEQRAALAEIAAASGTIHALIGYHPDLGRARFDARNPLGCQVLVVDECSMVDALLWRALLESLPPASRLILLGDPNQLESVGQGNVFAELARVAASPSSKLFPCHVHLTEARRFKDRPAISELSRALEVSDAGWVEQILRTSAEAPDRGVAWIETHAAGLDVENFPAVILDALESVAVAPTPAEALGALDRVCVLTAQREHFVGAKAMSEAIEIAVSRRAGARNHPIIINRNDPETGLRNGTVGVIHVDSDGRRKAWFRGLSDSFREFAVAGLPDYSPAWAITIHRSQGSEYDNVLVVVPRGDSPLATRELLYTAVTRARRNVFVAGDLPSIRKAVTTPSARTTLLAFHLNNAG